MSRKRQSKSNFCNAWIVILITFAIIIGIIEYPSIDNDTYENNNTEIIRIENEKLKIYFFDVGQADSIFITSGEETMLIDAGNNEDGELIVDFLKNDLKINKIDYLIGTHPHEDHIGGLDDIIQNFDIEQILMPKKSSTTKTFKDVLNVIEAKELKINAPKIGDKFDFGNCICEIMSIDNEAEDANNASIVIELTCDTQKYLFTGDIESEVETSRNWNDVDLLKISHHGSNTSTTHDFIKQVNPEISIISVGKDNDYNHPHEKILKRLNYIKSLVYRTDLDGTIVLISDGKTNEIQKINISLDGNK